MDTQTLTIGKRRFILIAERDFQRLQKKAGSREIRPEFGAEAMRDLHAYKRTKKAVKWSTARKNLGL